MANRSNHPMYRDDDRETPARGNNYRQMNEQQLERHRDEEMARQDLALDEIHRGVKGLKGHAHAINNEVVDQNALIDDVNDRMDGAQRDLELGEARAREVNSRKAKVCKMYGVIALLVVAEVVMSIAGLKFF